MGSFSTQTLHFSSLPQISKSLFCKKQTNKHHMREEEERKTYRTLSVVSIIGALPICVLFSNRRSSRHCNRSRLSSTSLSPKLLCSTSSQPPWSSISSETHFFPSPLDRSLPLVFLYISSDKVQILFTQELFYSSTLHPLDLLLLHFL